MPTMLWIGAAVVSLAVVAIALMFRRHGDPNDLGSVSRSWTIEHNASHGKDSSS